MDLTKTAFGSWSGGRFMHFGEPVDDAKFCRLVELSHELGTRTFITADVYGVGRADELLGQALKGLPRDSYSLVGIIGHDIYDGIRQGSKGYPRFTDPSLRDASQYSEYLHRAAGKQLERCGVSKFDCLLLHNPDTIGYSSPAVWEAMASLKTAGLTDQLGIAPGPANGFTLDMVECFEKFAEFVDWAMIILNPLEPWPGRLPLGAAEANGVRILARVVDHGGLFWDDVKAGHRFRDGDHRSYRPEGWVEHGLEKVERLRPIAERHGLTMVQLASQWCLAQSPVESVVPTLIQESGPHARPIEDKVRELAATPDEIDLSAEEIEEIASIGNNEGCMLLKGASQRHEGQENRSDEWPLRDDLLALADKWELGRNW